jgi:hypothetical protein
MSPFSDVFYIIEALRGSGTRQNSPLKMKQKMVDGKGSEPLPVGSAAGGIYLLMARFWLITF